MPPSLSRAELHACVATMVPPTPMVPKMAVSAFSGSSFAAQSGPISEHGVSTARGSSDLGVLADRKVIDVVDCQEVAGDRTEKFPLSLDSKLASQPSVARIHNTIQFVTSVIDPDIDPSLAPHESFGPGADSYGNPMESLAGCFDR